MGLRTLLLALAVALLPTAALAGTDIVATCYARTRPIPAPNKACVARAADKADAAYQAYKAL